MIIEELIAKLGFKVEGLSALRDAARRLKDFAKSVLNALNPMKRAAAATNPLKAGMQNVARSTAPAVSAMSKFGSVARTVMIGVLGVATAVAGAAAGVALLGLAFARAGAKAARARRELQFQAEGKGTSENRLNLLRNTFAASAGVGEKVAGALVDDLIAGITDKTKLALAGDAEAKQELAKVGINPRGKDGRPADTSALALQAATRIIAENQKAEGLRKKGKTAQANQVDEKNNKMAADFGIKDELLAFLKSFPTPDALVKEMAKAGSRDAGATDAQRAREKSVSQQYTELEQKLGTIGESFARLGIIIANEVLPPLNSFIDGIVSIGKRLGLINQTREEMQIDRNKARAEGMKAERQTYDSNIVGTAGEKRRRAVAEAPAKLQRLRDSTAEQDRETQRGKARSPQMASSPGKGASDRDAPSKSWVAALIAASRNDRNTTGKSAMTTEQDRETQRGKARMATPAQAEPSWLAKFSLAASSFTDRLNAQATAGVNRDAGLTATVKPDQITAKADVDVKTDVSVKVEPSSELLKVIASARTAGAMAGKSIAAAINKAGNTGTGALASP